MGRAVVTSVDKSAVLARTVSQMSQMAALHVAQRTLVRARATSRRAVVTNVDKSAVSARTVSQMSQMAALHVAQPTLVRARATKPLVCCADSTRAWFDGSR